MPKETPKVAPEPNAEAGTPAPTPRAATPFADRAIALIEDLSRAVDGLHAKALSYHDPGVVRDMHPQIEQALRLQVRTMTAMVDQINCPTSFVPGVTPIPPPPHIGESSLEEAAFFKAKQERAAKVNAIPITTEQRARAQAAEARSLQALTSLPTKGPNAPR